MTCSLELGLVALAVAACAQERHLRVGMTDTLLGPWRQTIAPFPACQQAAQLGRSLAR